MRVAVAGGGIFGVTTAWKLAAAGHTVTLFESSNDILQAASMVNQYRLHRGYHYPRSLATAVSSKQGLSSFAETYPECIVRGPDHYYCIAKQDSLTTPEQFRAFCSAAQLPYTEGASHCVDKNAISYSVRVTEDLFDHQALYHVCKEKLARYGVHVVYRGPELDELTTYDFVVYALYANTNHYFRNRPSLQRKLQFEVCEKPVLKLPPEFKGQSVVIMDGPFTCIDPLGNTDYHLMGHVVHAIHHTSVGLFPEVPEHLQPLLNKGIIANPPVTRVPAMIANGKTFFKGIEHAKHIGSMFTVRTVQPNRDDDDGRPTIVEHISPREILLFSGKIGTCVDAADTVCDTIARAAEDR